MLNDVNIPVALLSLGATIFIISVEVCVFVLIVALAIFWEDIVEFIKSLLGKGILLLVMIVYIIIMLTLICLFGIVVFPFALICDKLLKGDSAESSTEVESSMEIGHDALDYVTDKFCSFQRNVKEIFDIIDEDDY